MPPVSLLPYSHMPNADRQGVDIIYRLLLFVFYVCVCTDSGESRTGCRHDTHAAEPIVMRRCVNPSY